MIEAVIFDMDGLLIDSEPLWHRAEIAVFASVGHQLSSTDCRQTCGIRIDQVVELYYARKPWSNKSREQVCEEIQQEVERLCLSEGRALPGARELIEECASLGLPLAVASSSSMRMIRAVIAHLGLAGRFRVLCSAGDEAQGKPDPAVYLSTAAALGIAPERCLAFEDSVAGVQAAHAAGMRVVAVPDAHHYERPEYALAARKYRSLREVELSSLL